MAYQPVQGVAMTPPRFVWSTETFDCMKDNDSCIEGWCCLHCQLSRQYNMEHFGVRDLHLPFCLAASFLDGCTGSCIGAAVLSFVVRYEYIQKLGFEHDMVHEVVMNGCCVPCATCQTYREMTVRGQWPGGCCIDTPPAIVTAPVPHMMPAQQQNGYQASAPPKQV